MRHAGDGTAGLLTAIVPSAITGHRTKGVGYRTLLPPPDPVHLMLTWRRDDISSPLTNFLRLATA